jgi:hypothetical protein
MTHAAAMAVVTAYIADFDDDADLEDVIPVSSAGPSRDAVTGRIFLAGLFRRVHPRPREVEILQWRNPSASPRHFSALLSSAKRSACSTTFYCLHVHEVYNARTAG